MDPEDRIVSIPDAPLATADPMITMLGEFMRSGRSPEEGRAFMDLIRDMRREKAKTEYQVAMNRAQQRMPIIVRDGQNTQTNSRYAKFETVLFKAKPVINEEGFSLTFGEEDCPYQDTCPGPTPDSPPLILRWKRTKLTIMHVGGHSVTETLDLPVDGIGPKGNAIGGMNKVQGAISTGSYAQRVMICRAFNIAIAATDLDGSTQGTGIGPDEIGVLNDLIGRLAGLKPAFDLKAFLGVFGAIDGAEHRADLGDLKTTDFWPAFRLLNKRIPETIEDPEKCRLDEDRVKNYLEQRKGGK